MGYKSSLFHISSDGSPSTRERLETRLDKRPRVRMDTSNS